MNTFYVAMFIATIHSFLLLIPAWRRYFGLARTELPYYVLAGFLLMLVLSLSLSVSLGYCSPKKLIEAERFRLSLVEPSILIERRSNGDPIAPAQQSYIRKAIRVQGKTADGSGFEMTLLIDRNLIIVEENELRQAFMKKGLLKLDESHYLAEWAFFPAQKAFELHVPKGTINW